MSDLIESRSSSVADSGSCSKMGLKRKEAEPEDGNLISDRPSINFRKKPRMRCIDWRDSMVFHFEFPDDEVCDEEEEEDWEVEEDEPDDGDDDIVGSGGDQPDGDEDRSFEDEDKDEHEEEAVLSSHESSSNIKPRIRCFAVRDFPPLLHKNPADAPPVEAPSESHEEESEPEEDEEWDEGVDESHMDISDDGSASHGYPEDTDLDEFLEVLDSDKVQFQSNLDEFNADEAEHDEVDSPESSIRCTKRPSCFAVRDFPPCPLHRPADESVQLNEEELEPVEDYYSDNGEGTDESVMLNPREDDSDETQSDLELDSDAVHDEHQGNELVEAEDDQTSVDYNASDDEADLSGYITCL